MQKNPARKGAHPLADFVAPCIGPVLSRQGFGEADVLMHWAEIVGADLAERCRPVKLQWRPRAVGELAEPATLVVRVEGAFALRLQHMVPVVTERVNVYFGWRCVGKIVLKQGPLPPVACGRAKPPPPDAATTLQAERLTSAFAEPRLAAALAGLGARVLGNRRRPG